MSDQIDTKALRADMMTQWTTVTRETAFADQIRWHMTAPEDRADAEHFTRFGGGRRLSAMDYFMVAQAALDQEVDAAYLEFGKRAIPAKAVVFVATPDSTVQMACDLWMSIDGELKFIARPSNALIEVRKGVFSPSVRCTEPDAKAGIKRAKAFLQAMSVAQPGSLRDQHFFEDCTPYASFRQGMPADAYAAA